MLVVDASVLAPVVADAGDDGRRFRTRLRSEVILGPDLLRLEVVSVLRRHARRGALSDEQVDLALRETLAFPVVVYPTTPLLPRVWDLRHNVSAYDGCYVALAEVADCPLVTADHRLAGAPGIRCAVEVL
ncbi:MAG: type II toxin-antitoxin system VapC family toxin [Microthrixaceae bacterium]